eukprot:Gb_37263 [translate_table: standard]
MARQGMTNGGLLYHEVQESKLCAVHCVNTVLQGPFFSEFDLATIAADLDQRETQMMMEGGLESADYLRFVSEDSSNVAMDGDFSIQVLEKALEIWDLHVIPLESPLAEQAQTDPQNEEGFICHLQDHWFCIRKIDGEWYNFNSLYPAPEHLSRFYLSAYLDTLKSAGWSIFLVRGNFPRECPVPSSETSNGFGQWLTPDDAHRITKSTEMRQNASCGQQPVSTLSSTADMHGGATSPISISNYEDSQLRAAIAASLGDAPPLDGNVKVHSYYPDSFDRSSHSMQSVSDEEDQELMAAIAASLKDSTSDSGTSNNQVACQSPAFTALKPMQPGLLGQNSELMAAVTASLKDPSVSTNSSGHADVSQCEVTLPATTKDNCLEKQDPTLMAALVASLENPTSSQSNNIDRQASQLETPIIDLIPDNSIQPNVSQLAAAMAASLANVQVPPQRDHEM